jgi:nicotinate-nucleotide adenylyltransferase
MGGSFDPIHMAHLIMAETVREALALNTVLFVPVAEQPLKQGLGVTPAEQRVEMVSLAIADNPYFALSRVEVERPGPSYTVDTLLRLREELGQRDKTEMWFVIGADALATLPRWRDVEGILAQTRLAVVSRPGVVVDMATLQAQLPRLQASIDWVEAPLIDISATDLRRRVADDLSIRYRVPDVVREYIGANGLYRRVAGRA